VLRRCSRALVGVVAAIMLLVTPAQASADVPPVSPQAQAAGLIDVRSVVPDARIDLRYASANNFVGIQLYPSDARCLVHESLGPGLAVAAEQLRKQGLRLVFWDCYRPHDVQVRMFEAVPNPNWVARPTDFARSHESGRSVDVTVADGHYGWLADMGTDFDDFTPRSLAYATDGVSAEQQANRARLREAMSAGGLTVYSGEWWHFDGPGAKDPRPILDVPVN
jgi:D-alanyl-D-alanine dipeptidase